MPRARCLATENPPPTPFTDRRLPAAPPCPGRSHELVVILQANAGRWPAALGRIKPWRQPTISLPEKNWAISFAAVSGASEPCTEFSPIDLACTLRMVFAA